MKVHLLSCLVALMLMFSCDPGDDAQNPDFGYDYLPMSVGYYRVYNVSTTHYVQNVPTASEYQLKIKVVSSYETSDGTTYLLRLQKRTSSADTWVSFATNSIRLSADQAIESERNIPVVKLTFPIEPGATWDGNQYNALGGKQFCENDRECDIFNVQSIHEKFIFSQQQSFENSVVINQEDKQNDITFKDVRTEIYSRGIGLVYKDSVYYKYCDDSQDACYGKEFIRSGTNYKQVLTAYGVE